MPANNIMHALKNIKTNTAAKKKSVSLTWTVITGLCDASMDQTPGEEPRYTNTDVAWEHFNALVSEIFSVF